MHVPSAEHEIIVELQGPILMVVTEEACPTKQCDAKLPGFLPGEVATSWKIGATTMEPSSLPDMRRDPSSLISRQETDLECAGNV